MIHAGELCIDRQLFHLVPKRALTNDHVVVPNFNAFINCLIGSLKKVLILRVKTRDVFFKRQYCDLTTTVNGKGPLVSNNVCDSWASSISRRYFVYSSFPLHSNLTPDELVQMEKSSFFNLSFGVLLYRRKA